MLPHSFLFGQDSLNVSIKSPIVIFLLEKDFASECSHQIDTSLHNIQNYFPNNNFSYSLGLANRKLTLEPLVNIGFKTGFEELDLFGFNRSETRYYYTRMPYTEIAVVFGQKKEQMTKLIHTQNINRKWNIAVNMLRMRSEGFYNRQNCTNNNISLSSNYTSKNNRYSFLVNGIISAIKADENGGIKYDTLFEANLFSNKKLFAVNLLNARTRRGKREFTFTQFLNFGKKDSVKYDTTKKFILRPENALSYSFHLKENWFVYDDKNPKSGFYENIFSDSVNTYDSTSTFKMENIISFAKKRNGNVIAMGNETSKLKMQRIDTLVSSLYVTGSFNKSLHECNINFSGKYYFNGYNNKDYEFFGKIKKLFSKKYHLSLSGKLAETFPAFIFNKYISNHFLWENDLEKIKFRDIELNFYKHSPAILNLSVRLIQVFNHTYFNYSFLPSQFSKAINIYSVTAQKTFTFKKIKWHNKLIYQSVTNDSVLHLPQFIFNHSLYFHDKWFKQKVDTRTGLDITYFSYYYGDSYMPALGLYYLQSDKKIGNYPFIDFFFSMKVKQVRIFLKLEHVNSGLMGAYYLAPHIPSPDRNIKVGVNWIFYD